MRALKVLNGWLLHVLIDHFDQMADAGSGDGHVYEASDNLSELFLIAGRSGAGT